MPDVLVAEEVHQVVGSIAVVLVLGHECHLALPVIAVGILLEGRPYESYLRGCGGAGVRESEIRFGDRTILAPPRPRAFAPPRPRNIHEHLDQLCRAVARHDVGLAHPEALAGQERVHLHARGIFRQQRVEVGPQFIFHPAAGEVGVHQIAVVEHLWESPESAVAAVVFADDVLLVGEEGLGDVQVLLVVDLVPLLLSDGQGLQVVAAEQREDAQHVLVVFVQSDGLRVGVEEGHVFLAEEVLAELIDVDRLVVTAGVGIVEGRLRDEVDDVLFVVDLHHRAVHPTFVFGHQSQIGVGVLQDHRDQTVAEDEVALQQQRVVLLQPVLDDRQRVDVVRLVVDGVLGEFYLQPPVIAVADILAQLAALVAHHDDDPLEPLLLQLPEQPVDEPHTVHRDHTLRVVPRIFSQSAAHAGRQYNCLHPLSTFLPFYLSTFSHPTWLPGFTSFVVVTTLRLSSASTAERIMPWLSMPIIWRGAKLATNRMRLPISSSGFS